MASLRLTLLGAFQASLDDTALNSFESNKVRALLVYLAVECDRPHSREALADLLWPDWPQHQAQYYLRNALSDLRGLLGDRQAQRPVLLISHDTVQLGPAAECWSDVAEFVRAAQPADQNGAANIMYLKRAVDLYRGAFLEGFTVDSLPFEEWALLQRERLHRLVLSALRCLAEYSLERGAYEQACRYAQRQVELEPWLEEAYRQWMLALARSGERSEALALYWACRSKLAEELGVAPGSETVRLYERIRDGEISAQETRKSRFHNLPEEMTSFIGRENEIAAVQHLLQSRRLVTLTGSGGVGKTRLARQVARELLEQYPDGAWLVEFAPLADPGLAPQVVARDLGLGEQSGSRAVTLLQDYLAKKHTLVIFDNCEHLVDACASLASALPSACPLLTILVTSRVALQISGEVTFRVPSMTLPAGADQTRLEGYPGHAAQSSLQEIQQSESVRLFVARAESASPGFALLSENAPAVARVCQRLDGIPLAIELAAARSSMLQVEEIARRLDNRFHLLTGGSRAALPRYQTLLDSIDWSYNLISPPERLMLQALSVFAGGWTLEAAESVGMGPLVGAKKENILPLLSSLVNQSMVNADLQPGLPARYRMLETIRLYAQDRLAESGQTRLARDEHLQYYLRLAEDSERKLRGNTQLNVVDLLQAELDNIRLALSWALERTPAADGLTDAGLRIASALLYYWAPCYRYNEGLSWLERLLARGDEWQGESPADPEKIKHRAKALYTAAWLAYPLGENQKSITMNTESRALYKSLGPDGRRGYAYTSMIEGLLQLINGSTTRAIRFFEEGCAIMKQEGDLFGESEMYLMLGVTYWGNLEYDAASRCYQNHLAIKKEIGDLDGVAGNFFFRGLLAFDLRQDAAAYRLFEKSLAWFKKIRNLYSERPLYYLAVLDAIQGNFATAAQRFEQILDTGRRQGNDIMISGGLLNLGVMALAQDNFSGAAQRFEESLEINRKTTPQENLILTLWYLGNLYWAKGDLQQAHDAYLEVFRLGEQILENKWYAGYGLLGLGREAFARCEFAQAREYLKEALQDCTTYNINTWDMQCAVEALAFVELEQRDWARAARLLGATQAHHSRMEKLRTSKEREMREQAIVRARSLLGEADFQQAWDAGKAMDMKQAVEYALATRRQENSTAG